MRGCNNVHPCEGCEYSHDGGCLSFDGCVKEKRRALAAEHLKPDDMDTEFLKWLDGRIRHSEERVKSLHKAYARNGSPRTYAQYTNQENTARALRIARQHLREGGQ